MSKILIANVRLVNDGQVADGGLLIEGERRAMG
jgi:hypothetical protein